MSHYRKTNNFRRMKKQIVLAFLVFSSVLNGFTQTRSNLPAIDIESRSMVSSAEAVPFWMQMNQQGIYDSDDSFQQLFLLGLTSQESNKEINKVQLTYGLLAVGRISDHSDFQLVNYWGRVNWKNWYIHLGAKPEPVFGNGLSLTNGNLFLSNNARPMPRVGFGTNDFQLFQSGWLSRFAFDFEYNEYFLIDDRYVEDANLHHKRLDVKYTFLPRWELSVGLDHWVFWGGVSPTLGKIPGWEDYLRYITGRVGGDSAPSIDQANVAGNQLGQYLVSITNRGEHNHWKFYWQHLWEDRSGIQLENAPDGLWGVMWHRKTDSYPLLEAMVVEYTNTRDQSGEYHKHRPDPENPDYEIGEGRDNYFTHGVYRSGFVSYNRMMGLPLFVPAIGEDGISTGFSNTRLWGIHQGMSGWLSEDIEWKSWLTYSKHYGNYGAEYDSSKSWLSVAAQVGYFVPDSRWQVKAKLAYDDGAVLDSGFGAELRLLYAF
ncbi:capsule assembly protein Wzi [Sunxiuqinia elliptica]|nr:capsule assembly protein Wzi [Sunxiuqinia elliptica]